MLKIGFSVSLVIFVILLIWIYGFSKKCEDSQEITEQELKEVIITSDTDSVVFFNVPEDWNAFYYGDSQLVTDLNNIGGRLSIISSVSVADRPVTHSDINWSQVDFYLTDGDLIDEAFINKEKLKEGQTIKAYQGAQFEGYIITDLLENGEPNKFDTGGSTYFLRPLIDKPTWNLIVNKQTLGFDEFEQEVRNLIDSLKIQDYDEYIDEINN